MVRTHEWIMEGPRIFPVFNWTRSTMEGPRSTMEGTRIFPISNWTMDWPVFYWQWLYCKRISTIKQFYLEINDANSLKKLLLMKEFIPTDVLVTHIIPIHKELCVLEFDSVARETMKRCTTTRHYERCLVLLDETFPIVLMNFITNEPQQNYVELTVQATEGTQAVAFQNPVRIQKPAFKNSFRDPNIASRFRKSDKTIMNVCKQRISQENNQNRILLAERRIITQNAQTTLFQIQN